jgi:hypothetical protein
MQIITDHKEKLFKMRSEVPAEVLKDFDYVDETSETFIQYRGVWYNLCDFMIVDKTTGTDLKDWDGYITETFFSGIVIKIPKYKTETYIIGRYWS